MSRSNPTDATPNPSTRWFEWNGAKGHFRYYDKEKKEQVNLKPDFIFIVLDQLSSVRGWHEPSQSGIVSNEVRSTNEEPLIVRSFKGGKIAAGLYSEIKDRVANAGGHFTSTLYCGFKDGSELVMGAAQLKGAALSAWFEFAKANRKAIWEQAIRVKGSKKDKKGQVEFHVPIFSLQPVSEDTQKESVFLDVELQEYLKGYFARTQQQSYPAEAPQPDAPAEYGEQTPEPPPQDDVPVEDEEPPF